MSKASRMVRLVRMVAVLFGLLGVLMLFIYSPFYSQLVVKLLNSFVPVEVDQVAAKSQQMAALSEHDTLEPGSNLWIARQAYLELMEQAMQSEKAEDLMVLQQRYKALQQIIQEQQAERNDEDEPNIPLLQDKDQEEASSAENDPAQAMRELMELDSRENQALMKRYLKFLRTHPVEATSEPVVDPELQQEIALLQNQNSQKQEKPVLSQPYAIVVLGGGLTLAANQKDIVVNNYTRLRLEKTLEVERKNQLPIVLSGVEAPFMQAWLKERHVDAKLLENRSMNTCENSRFSSLLLQKKGGAPTVILITDRYHMPRTRRLFALNGIETIPVEAPMPTQLTRWRPSEQNYDHSRRANYELLATIRDVLFGSSDCREVP